MKFEWKKQEKDVYLPSQNPSLLVVPKYKYIMLSGKGNPNTGEFSEKIGVLYLLSYAIKMLPKKGHTPEGYYDYVVYPLEGIWDLTDKGKGNEYLDKNELLYTIMIRQPDFVTQKTVEIALEIIKKKEYNSILDEIVFETMEDGLSVQILHVGSYDDEPQSFDKIKQFMNHNNLVRATLKHREVYISDARKTEKDKLKTVLRYMVYQN